MTGAEYPTLAFAVMPAREWPEDETNELITTNTEPFGVAVVPNSTLELNATPCESPPECAVLKCLPYVPVDFVTLA
jgi:hypothetical protein